MHAARQDVTAGLVPDWHDGRGLFSSTPDVIVIMTGIVGRPVQATPFLSDPAAGREWANLMAFAAGGLTVMSMSTPLPKCERPPINEVVMGVQFEPLKNIHSAMFGLYWQRIRNWRQVRGDEKYPEVPDPSRRVPKGVVGLPWVPQ